LVQANGIAARLNTLATMFNDVRTGIPADQATKIDEVLNVTTETKADVKDIKHSLEEHGGGQHEPR
jgi:hypothetical protein